MRPANPLGDRYRAYRRRLVANGRHQLIVDLPRETVAFIDAPADLHDRRRATPRAAATGHRSRLAPSSMPPP